MAISALPSQHSPHPSYRDRHTYPPGLLQPSPTPRRRHRENGMAQQLESEYSDRSRSRLKPSEGGIAHRAIPSASEARSTDRAEGHPLAQPCEQQHKLLRTRIRILACKARQLCRTRHNPVLGTGGSVGAGRKFPSTEIPSPASPWVNQPGRFICLRELLMRRQSAAVNDSRQDTGRES